MFDEQLVYSLLVVFLREFSLLSLHHHGAPLKSYCHYEIQLRLSLMPVSVVQMPKLAKLLCSASLYAMIIKHHLQCHIFSMQQCEVQHEDVLYFWLFVFKSSSFTTIHSIFYSFFSSFSG